MKGAAALLALAGLAAVQTRAAGRLEPYGMAAFSAQQQKNGYIVLQFHSSACNVCPRQETTIERLSKEPSQPPVQFYQAIFEREEELRKLYQVSAMSTLLVFRGRFLIGRSAGLYTEDEIRTFLMKTMAEDRGRPKVRPKRKFGTKR